MVVDRVEKKIVLHAERKRVWHAIADSKEFGSWFGMRIEGSFTAGAEVRAVIAPSSVDLSSAQAAKEFSGITFVIRVEKVEPERLFSFRWHPHAIERDFDYTNEPTTLVEFELEEVPGGIQLTVTESGFDRIPLSRRATAFTANSQGWAIQLTRIEKHVSRST